MYISTKGRYAVRILLDIAQNGGGGSVRTQDIALRQQITPKYTEQLTALLVKGGLLRSVRGAGGGYCLVKQPNQYTIAEILHKAEGNFTPVECAAESGVCPREESCVVRGLWRGLDKVINDYLQSVTLQTLLDRLPDGGDNYMI